MAFPMHKEMLSVLQVVGVWCADFNNNIFRISTKKHREVAWKEKQTNKKKNINKNQLQISRSNSKICEHRNVHAWMYSFDQFVMRTCFAHCNWAVAFAYSTPYFVGFVFILFFKFLHSFHWIRRYCIDKKYNRVIVSIFSIKLLGFYFFLFISPYENNMFPWKGRANVKNNDATHITCVLFKLLNQLCQRDFSTMDIDAM